MTCQELLERLLEAEPAELAGEGDSDVATHVRTCARCRAVAERIRADEAALAQLLAAYRPRRTVDELLASARNVESDVVAFPTPAQAEPRVLRRLLPWLAAPLAAAAAFVLWLRAPEQPPLDVRAALVRAEPALSAPVVQVPAGRRAVLFETDNPKLTVIWIF